MNPFSPFRHHSAHGCMRPPLATTTCSRTVARMIHSAMLLLLIGLTTALQAAVIEVDSIADTGVVEVAADGLCSIREAIDNANDDSATHADCAAGDGADTITLSAAAVFTLIDAAVHDSSYGKSGLPHITSDITLDGNGAIIQRDNSLTCNPDGVDDPGEFRLILIGFGGDLEVRDLTLAQGCADGDGTVTVASQYGGAILHIGSSLTLHRVTMTENFAHANGGGLSTSLGAPSLIEDSTFSDNRAASGGAMYARSDVSLRNTTLSGNSAEFRGGGILSESAMIRLEQITFSNNTAEDAGGALHVDDNLIQNPAIQIKNVIFQHSSCSVGSVFDSEFLAEGANVDSGSSCADVFGLGFSANTDAALAPLADNGGATHTHALLAWSPALETATDCTGLDNDPIKTDQRGVARPQPADGNCEIGAFELELGIAISKTVTSGNPYAAAGDIINYDLVAENTGDATLNNVVISDPEATGGCSISALPPRSTLTCPASYVTSEEDVVAGSFTNTASVTAQAPGDSTIEASDSATAHWVRIFTDRFESGD